MWTTWIVLLLAVVSATSADRAGAADHRLSAGLGIVGLKSHDQVDVVADLEYRGMPWKKLWNIYPTAGVFVTDAEAAHIRAGFGRDFELGELWRLTITTAAGAYEQGDGKDLGHTIEFRSAIELARAVGRAEVGLSISHLSNASISDFNPGVEVALVTVTFPVGRRSDP